MAEVQIKDYLRETSLIQSRLVIATILIIVLTLAVVIRMFFLQVRGHEHYATLSQDNRINLVAVPPVRGLIYDRNGTTLAENIPVYQLEVVPDLAEDLQDLLDQLSQFLQIDQGDRDEFMKLVKRRPGFENLTLRSNLSDDEIARFAVNRHRFPGVDIVARLQRRYPLGELTAPVVGYVGRISEKDLKVIDRASYRGTKYIGKLGIEARYEDVLLGKVGFEQVETNAHGRVVRQLSRTAPEAGSDLHLSLDIRLQQVAMNALGDFQGAVVAIEPASGDVLAFASNPTYDANLFVNGIDSKTYEALRNSEQRPLLNRALHGRYAPGSSIKGVVGLAGLNAGRDSSYAVYCPGWFSLPNSKHRYRCWKKSGHGMMNLHDAIVQSCDVYFYQLAHNLGINYLHEFMSDFGFGVETEIDLEDEPSGLMPSREWKRAIRGQPWYPGETVITGIGQGYMLTTPLQLAMVAATLANRGDRIPPRLVSKIGNAATNGITPLIVAPAVAASENQRGHYETVIDAMTDVVHGKRGTARRISTNSFFRIAGKTGTAQVVGIGQNKSYDASKLDRKFHDHALFLSFAPVENPQIAVAVVAENGGSGSRTAAPIAKLVMEYYMLTKDLPAGSDQLFADLGP